MRDAVGQLTKLKQWRTVRLYQDKFKEMATKSSGLSEEFFISCFVSGLREEVRAGVQMFQPKTISQAMGLACLQEETSEAFAMKGKTYSKLFVPHQSIPPKTAEVHPNARALKPEGPIKKLTQKDFDEKRAKGCVLVVMKSTIGDIYL